MTTAFLKQPTLATLLDHIATAPPLTDSRRREMASGVRTVCRVLGVEAHMVPISTPKLQPLLAGALPARVRVSGVRWRNAKSLLRQALALLDPAALPARSKSSLLPSWMTALDQVTAVGLQRGLARFSRWCSVEGIGPHEVTQDTYEAFYDDITARCLLRSPRETQQTAGRAWNKACATVPGWPKAMFTIKNMRRNPSLPLDALPPSLKHQIDLYVAAHEKAPKMRLDEDHFEFQPSTVKTKVAQLRQLITAMVAGGVPASDLTTLADLVDPERVNIGLLVLADRRGKVEIGSINNIANLVVALARHEVKAATDVIDRLRKMARNTKPKPSGMVLKNRIRLMAFNDPRTLDHFLALPRLLMEAARSVAAPSVTEALLAQHAIALEILTVAPLRISNIAALELDRTLVIAESRGCIIVGAEEVKNKKDLEIPLPRSTVEMIRFYLKRFHSVLALDGSKMLFPSRLAPHKCSVALSNQLKQRVRVECGIDFNVHMARHLAAKLYLEANPGAYGVVMLLLGHKSIETTIRAYCGTETKAAFADLGQLIATKRDADVGVWG